MAEEKRKVPRLKKDLMARYAPEEGPHASKWDESLIIDISESGIKIFVARNFSEGDILKLRLKIPSHPKDLISVKGKIVAMAELKNIFGSQIAQTYIASLSFVDLDDRQKESIREFILSFNSSNGGEK